MAKGITFSITLPSVMVDEYDKRATELDTSRSKIVGAILINDFIKNQLPTDFDIDCEYCQKGVCSIYEEDCVLLDGACACEKQSKR